MDRALNPYNPGAGLRPPALIGRDAEREALASLINRVAHGNVGRGQILSGLRGVGKTVLLNELADHAEAANWVVARLEARGPSATREPFALQLARSLRSSLHAVSGRAKVKDSMKAALATFKSFGIKLDPAGTVTAGIEVDAARGRANSGYITADLVELAADLAAAAQANGAGVGIFIDELQDADAEIIAALCGAVHTCAQRGLPFYVIGAGLPSLPGVLSEAATYAERLFEYRRIENLNPHDSQLVLTEPAAVSGVSWEPTAIAIAIGESNGYPYFLQEYGRAAWDAAPGPSRITQADMLFAITNAREALDAGFFRSRWSRATPAEREYLSAMAIDGAGPSVSSEIASRLGRTMGALGPARAKLISKGLIFSPQHGQIAYTVPGMADYVRRQED